MNRAQYKFQVCAGYKYLGKQSIGWANSCEIQMQARIDQLELALEKCSEHPRLPLELKVLLTAVSEDYIDVKQQA